MNSKSINTDDITFLQGLKDLANYPKSLYLIGNLPDTPCRTLAIIGTRKPTPYGRDVAYRLAYDLAKAGVVIVSGLAIGIDTIAHQAALDAGGVTIAVLAGGLDKVHPPSNYYLAQTIANKGGGLLSQYKPGIPAYRSNFVARNRLESGISSGVLVIEASINSGTMHTARFARQQSKPIMAVPGNITSPQSEGANSLIRTGAELVTNADQILQKIGHSQQTTLLPPLQDHILVKLIAAGVTEVAELQLKSALAPAVFSSELTLLELGGIIRSFDGNHWVLNR